MVETSGGNLLPVPSLPGPAGNGAVLPLSTGAAAGPNGLLGSGMLSSGAMGMGLGLSTAGGPPESKQIGKLQTEMAEMRGQIQELTKQFQDLWYGPPPHPCSYGPSSSSHVCFCPSSRSLVCFRCSGRCSTKRFIC
jgi:hypothetical protein